MACPLEGAGVIHWLLLRRGTKVSHPQVLLPLSDRDHPHLTLSVLPPSDNGEDLKDKTKQNKASLEGLLHQSLGHTFPPRNSA